jgi:hypothetical protein
MWSLCTNPKAFLKKMQSRGNSVGKMAGKALSGKGKGRSSDSVPLRET